MLEVAATGAIPIVLGGDHSITWPSATAVAEVRRPGSIGIVHFDAHADTAADDWGVLAGHGTPMRRLIESGAVAGRNFVQVGLRGYWPPVEVFEWMQAHGMRYHFMREIEERGADAVIAQAIDEALDGADYVYLSLDIDVIDPGLAPGTGTPEPGGMLTREVLRAIRQIVGRGRPRRDGHRRGVAAVRPRRDDRDGRQQGRARGDQRPRRATGRRKAVRWAGVDLGRHASPWIAAAPSCPSSPSASRADASTPPRPDDPRLSDRPCSTAPTPPPPRRLLASTTSI